MKAGTRVIQPGKNKNRGNCERVNYEKEHHDCNGFNGSGRMAGGGRRLFWNIGWGPLWRMRQGGSAGLPGPGGAGFCVCGRGGEFGSAALSWSGLCVGAGLLVGRMGWTGLGARILAMPAGGGCGLWRRGLGLSRLEWLRMVPWRTL